jgi:DNA-binding MarR family transcriptional regulator
MVVQMVFGYGRAVTAEEIASVTGVDEATVCRILIRLEERGLIRKKAP